MLVSVLLPYRDAEDTLEEAVSSVLADREAPIELVAIDDGSRDGGAAIVARLAERDPRVVRVESGGVGIARALMAGLARARGDFIARMDGDDVTIPGRFAAQIAALERDPRIGAIGTRVEIFPRADEGMVRYVEWLNALVTTEEHARDLFVESPLCHPSVMLRRRALESAGGWRDFDGPEDYDLWLRLDAAGFALAKVPEVLFRWRHHPRRATLIDPRYAIERFTETKCRYLAPRLLAHGRPFVVWGAGPTGKRVARALEAAEGGGARAARFVDIDPRKIGGVARGVPIGSPADLRKGEATVVVAVGARGARDVIRGDLATRGFVEGDDFVCAS